MYVLSENPRGGPKQPRIGRNCQNRGNAEWRADDAKGACSALPGAGTVLTTVGTQHGQCSEQKTPANRVGLCIGEVRPPHVTHGNLISIDRQHCDGPVVGTNLDRFRVP